MAARRDVMTLRRHVYTQEELDVTYASNSTQKTARERLRHACVCDKRSVMNVLLSYLPLVGVVRTYKWREDVLHDIVAGLSVAFMHMPQGLALGLLASVPPVYGLYATFFPILIYVIFGTSRHVSMGTNALTSLLTAIIVDRELAHHMTSLQTSSDTVTTTISAMTTATSAATLPQAPLTPDQQDEYKVGVASAVAFISGAILLAMGLLKLGFVTSYLATSFVGGFTTAAGVHIVTSQVSKMLHIKIPAHTGAGKIVKTYIDIFKNIGDSNPGDVVVSILSIAFLLLITIFVNERYKSKLKVSVPVDLLIVIIATIISHFVDLEDRYGVAIVGHIASGILPPTTPNMEVMSRISTDAFIIAILTFALSISMAKLMSRQHSYEIRDNQELVAYGLCNFVSSFFSCIPSCLAPPRTMILSNLNARSTLHGLVSAAFILVVLLVAGQLFVSLPIAVLAAMICAAMKNLLLQVTQLPRLWRISKPDFIIWTLTFLVSVFADLDIGIMAGVGVSILSVIILSQLVSGSLGGHSDTEDLVLLESGRTGVHSVQGVRIFHFPCQLYFANAETFKKEIFTKALNPASMQQKQREIDIKISCNDVSEEKNSGVSKDEEKSDRVAKLDVGNGQSGKEKTVEQMDYKSDVNGSKEETTRASDDVVTHVIVDCSAMTYVDLAGAEMMKVIAQNYQTVGVHLALANCPQYTRELLGRAGLFNILPSKMVFYSTLDALRCIQAETVQRRQSQD